VKPLGFHREDEQPLENPFDGAVHGPTGEWNVSPISECQSLEMLANGNRQEPTQAVVDLVEGVMPLRELGSSAQSVAGVALVTQVVDDLPRVDRQTNDVAVGRGVCEKVMQPTADAVAAR